MFWMFGFPLRILSIWFQHLLLLKMQMLILRSYECTFLDFFLQMMQFCYYLPFQLSLTFWKSTIFYELSLNACCQQHDSSMPGYSCLRTQWFSDTVYIFPEYFLFLSQAIREILLYKANCLKSMSPYSLLLFLTLFLI